jgi:formylmethanofuran dehydrogenase subunit E
MNNISQYELSQRIVEKAKVNIVTCGNCGEILIQDLKSEQIEITCPFCEFKGEPCDFPDYFHFTKFS